MGLAYSLQINDGLMWFNDIEEMLDHVRFLRANKQDYPHITHISFHRSVFFKCPQLEESKRIFDREKEEWERTKLDASIDMEPELVLI